MVKVQQKDTLNLGQPSKLSTTKWVEINDHSHGTYNTNSQIKFQTSMLKSNFCDYSDAYILVKGTISHKHRNSSSPNHRTLKAIFKN